MNINVFPMNLNPSKQNFKNSAILNNHEQKMKNSVSFSGIKDVFTKQTKEVIDPLSKEAEKVAKKEFKQLKRQATYLGVQVDKKDTIETLESKVIKAQQDDELLKSNGYSEPYFSHRLGDFVTAPVDKMIAQFIDRLPGS